METKNMTILKGIKQIVVEALGLRGPALLFFLAVVGTGSFIIFNQFKDLDLALLHIYLIWGLLAILSELKPIPFFKSLITVSSAIHLAAFILFDTPTAILVGTIGTGFVDILGRRGFNKLVFNICQYAITIYLAGWTFYFFKQSDTVLNFQQDFVAFILSCIIYFISNELMVCIIVALSTGTRFSIVFRKGFQLEAMHFPTMVPLAFLIAYLYQQEPLTIIFLIVPLAMAHIQFKNYVELNNQAQETLEVLADAIDHRDPYTARHSWRVAEYAEAIAQNMKLKDREVEQIKMAGRVHDIGKISISDRILQKTKPLSKEEFDAIKTHPSTAYSMLHQLKIYRKCAHYVLYHHERFDGQGYPEGLKGDAIPLGARILAVADTFDAITTNRPYRKARTKKQAIEEIRRCSGTQFDPKVVEAFLKVDLDSLNYESEG
ncbi:MAG: HD domain-containing protein [Peptococcaceae bacterium]|nr:HD domain-containing protein [Peptococcaceae bacterium]